MVIINLNRKGELNMFGLDKELDKGMLFTNGKMFVLEDDGFKEISQQDWQQVLDDFRESIEYVIDNWKDE